MGPASGGTTATLFTGQAASSTVKIRQTIQHFAAKKSLTLPIVGDKVREKLVDLHTRVFLERAPEDQREDRRDRLDVFFDATIDVYLSALDAGFTEAKAREITHIQANMEMARMGWVEMMEFPPDEIEQNVARFAGFFDEHGITLANPLGTFAPEGGLPDAPATPEKLEDGEAPFAEEGYADATYVEDEEGEIRTE